MTDKLMASLDEAAAIAHGEAQPSRVWTPPADVTDPDDAPEMTAEDFARADVYRAGQLVRRGRGRSKAAETREQIALRIDRALLERYRASGPGWQTRMHAALETMVGFKEQLAGMQESVAAIRDGRVSFHADDGRGQRSTNEEHIARLEKDMDELRRAIDFILPPEKAE